MINATDENGSRMSWAGRNDPIFEIASGKDTTYPNGDKLPPIWVTEPVVDDNGDVVGRTYAMPYPYFDHKFPFPGHADEQGEDALYYGACYYNEGMNFTDSADREKRIDCFRAAEVFYRHAAGRGNAIAYLNLGYVYSYDRCEGRYWRDSQTLNTAEDYKRPYPREERAFECFKTAAEADICEACYKLGDMYKRGVGCEHNAREAFRWYMRASEVVGHEAPVILGSVALRLGECYEEGIGTPVSFDRALAWYRKAVDCLSAAVEAGEVWYAKALTSARAGAKRCEQEMTP